LLAVEQRLLEGRSGEGVAIALAASRRLAHLLKVSELPTVRSTSAPTSLPHPSTSSSTSAKPKPTTTKSTTPNPQTSTSPPSNPLPTSRPTSPHHHHHHHHHHHLPNPLLGKGLLDNHG
jgi:hypothetical protein